MVVTGERSDEKVLGVGLLPLTGRWHSRWLLNFCLIETGAGEVNLTIALAP